MNRHSILSILVALLALAVGNSTASAALMTFNYTGTISSTNGVAFDGIPATFGDTITGTFSYDPSNPNAGTVTFVEQGHTLPPDAGSFTAHIAAGSFVQQGTLNGGLESIAFQLTPTVANGNFGPGLPPTLTQAQIASGLLTVSQTVGGSGSFSANNIQFSGGAPASVPEPASLTLMSLGGLLCAAVTARRRKRKTVGVADAASIG